MLKVSYKIIESVLSLAILEVEGLCSQFYHLFTYLCVYPVGLLLCQQDSLHYLLLSQEFMFVMLGSLGQMIQSLMMMRRRVVRNMAVVGVRGEVFLFIG